ncbi:MAG: aminotransferase class IV, partial [Proteobacteria bacterium]|nr:aminotransferase class IV [Pseudomonadota bacterium]
AAVYFISFARYLPSLPSCRNFTTNQECARKASRFLDGITRQTVIGLARARGIEVIERAIMPEEIGEADEVFLTGTAAEVTPVREIDGHNFQVGAITRGLLEDYDKLVREG